MCIPPEAAQIEYLEKKLKETTSLLDAIILACKERGECLKEVNDAAFEFGYSLSRKEFKWYDKKE